MVSLALVVLILKRKEQFLYHPDNAVSYFVVRSSLYISLCFYYIFVQDTFFLCCLTTLFCLHVTAVLRKSNILLVQELTCVCVTVTSVRVFPCCSE